MRRLLLPFTLALACAACLGNDSHGLPPTGKKQETMKTESNGLGVEFSLVNPRIRKAEELQAKAVLTNDTSKVLQINILFLDFTQLLLEVQTVDRKPVHPKPPPFPPADDGRTGRTKLLPGQSLTHIYRGSQYFGAPLSPGKYQVRFLYENGNPAHGDWTGRIVTEWVNFEVAR